MPSIQPATLIHYVCSQRLEKTNLENEKCVLSFVWDRGEVSGLSVFEENIKIILSTQREMHVFGQCYKS